MSTERFPVGLDSLIPETYKTQAETFAQCLRHKLLSLRGIDEATDSLRNESRKRLNNDCQVELESYTNPTTTLLSSYSNNNTSSVQNKGNDFNKKKDESLKEKKPSASLQMNEIINDGVDDFDEEEFYSQSESETSDTSEQKIQMDFKERIISGKINSNSSEDSNLDSWCSCLDNLTDSEKTDSEVEDSNFVGKNLKSLPKCYNHNIGSEQDACKNSSEKNTQLLINKVENEKENFDLDTYFQQVLFDNFEENKIQKKLSGKTLENENVKVEPFDEGCFKREEENSKNYSKLNLLSTDSNSSTNRIECKEGKKESTTTTTTEKELDIRLTSGNSSTNDIQSDDKNFKDFQTNSLNNSKNFERDLIKCDGEDNSKTVKDENSEESQCIVNTVECSIVDKQESKEWFLPEEKNNVDIYSSLNIITCNNLKTDEDVDDDSHSNTLKYLKRSSSLKTKKTPPGTPGAKKIVRFADALGLDLADVRTFLDEIPKIPSSAYEDLKYDFQTSSDQSLSQSTLMLVPLFQQPGLKMDFMEKINNQKICLETISVTDPSVLAITGYVRVQNIGYHKSVYVRYSLNNWKTFSDLQATYVPNSCDGYSDKFLFVLYGHTLKSGEKLEFALRLECCGSQYWDSNGGINYAFNCLPQSSANSFFPLTPDYTIQNQELNPSSFYFY